MEKETRNRIQNATQAVRRLLEQEYSEQLEGTFAILRNGTIAADAGGQLTDAQRLVRTKIVAAIRHKEAGGMKAAEAVADFIRDAAFTTLNRFAALKMLEARELVRECVSRGEESSGYKEFHGLATPLAILPEQQGYRLYLESIFDDLSSEIKVLFSRRDVASLLWPRRYALSELLDELNASALDAVWRDDETIGWIYQYFNADVDRQSARYDEGGNPKPPQDSRELAVRNQFFTPRYIVRFLVDNTVGQLWQEMRAGETQLNQLCDYLIHDAKSGGDDKRLRAKKDPRDVRVLDPACGSGHFLLYAFDLLLAIYDEAWSDTASPVWHVTGRTLREDYPDRQVFLSTLPALILRHNLYGVEIDPRCAQIAVLALWMRAQRAFVELGVASADRKPIRRTNVVVAEAIPGEEDLRGAFLSTLDPKLARLVGKVFRLLDRAGEAGLLLKVEQEIEEAIRELNPGEGPLLQSVNDERWHAAEDELTAALERYARSGRNGDAIRRQLFAEDAAVGFALIDVLRQRYDVVVMNPPFGDPTEGTKAYIDRKYPASRQDLFAVFVERAVRDLVPDGFVGVISTEAGFFRRTLEGWRRNVLLELTSMTVMAHLGGHVLDGATVRTAAYVLATGDSGNPESLFIRVLKQEGRHEKLLTAIHDADRSSAVFHAAQAEFEKLPYAVFGYWCSPELRDAFRTLPPLEANVGRVRQGLATADDFRFLRLRWEVPPHSVGQRWLPFAKGGEYSPFHDDVHLLVQWQPGDSELAAFSGSVIRNPQYYLKPGLTYPLRTNKRFAPRALRAGCAFGHKGPAIVDVHGSSFALLALLNSRPVSYLLSLAIGASDAEGGAGANSYEVGLVQRLPVPRGATADEILSHCGREAWGTRAERDLSDETSALFHSPLSPFATDNGDLTTIANNLARRERERDSRYVELQREIDRRVVALYQLADSDWVDIQEQVGEVERPKEVGVEPYELAVRLMQFFVGCAFGRWSVDALGARGVDLSAIEPLEGMAAHRDYRDGTFVLVDDPGAAVDIVTGIRSVLTESARTLLDELAPFFDPVGGVRAWLRTRFFDEHLKRYSKSRRRAPLYWQLSTPSASYSVWLYSHRVTRDSLFQIQREVVEPKLLHEQRALDRLTEDAGPSPTAQQRTAIDNQLALVTELRGFRDEIARVAPLWNPNLEDGTAVTMAPLWRLVPQHKAWQKELKETWDALSTGKHLWAKVAMHLWPELVVPECAKDRSLAIAHGFAEPFWFKDTEGKWRPRKVAQHEINQIVVERTSPAVKQALHDLLNAPAPGGTSKRGRRTSRRNRQSEAAE